MNHHRQDLITFDVPSCFKVEGVVGQGAYGAVCLAEWRGHKVAIKKIPNYSKSPETAKRVLREVEILDNFQYCTQVVASYTRFRPAVEKDVYIVMDYVASDLSTALKKSVPMDENIIRYITCQVLLAMRAMHRQRCIHRDLSSRNILLSNNSHAFVCDFGLSRFLDPEEQLSFGVVTQWYRSPEIVTDAPYDTPSDIWSVGVLMGELYLQAHMFAGKPNDPADQLKKIILVLGTPDPVLFREPGNSYSESSVNAKNYMESFISRNPLPNRFDHIRFKIEPSDAGRALLKRMLAFDPRERPSASEALENSYFDPLREFINSQVVEQDRAPPFQPFQPSDPRSVGEIAGRLEELVPVYSAEAVERQMMEAFAPLPGEEGDAAGAEVAASTEAGQPSANA